MLLLAVGAHPPSCHSRTTVYVHKGQCKPGVKCILKVQDKFFSYKGIMFLVLLYEDLVWEWVTYRAFFSYESLH